MDSSLKKVACISPRMNTRMLIDLNKTILNFPNLFTLRLDHCDLTSNHIKLLAENLKREQTVKELSLKGNPNKQQNFHLLIGCGLLILTLKFCEIDEDGLKKIGEEFLKCSPDLTLIHLDIASNKVFDEGCRHVAKILRCNRILRSLNLSDCKIGDAGFEEIMKSFQKFSLNEEEIYVRRKLRFEHYKLLQKEKDGYAVDKKIGVPDSDQEYVKDSLTLAKEKLQKHPFISESIPENGDIFCKGNRTLESINMSYNPLTKQSFDLILKSLMEQSSVFGNDQGIKRLVLEGNLDALDESAQNAIEELLLNKKTRKSTNGSVKVRTSLKRRKSSAASSVTIESNKIRERSAQVL